MKKTAVVVLFIIILVIIGALYYVWSQVTQLPEWYTGAGRASDGSVITYGKGIGDIRRSLERTVEDQLRKARAPRNGFEILLKENDANKLFAAIISENAGTNRYLNAIKASRTRITDGDLDFGVVVDASQLAGDASGRSGKGTLLEAVPLSGLLKGREISLGFTGKYGLKANRLQLDEDGKIRIGTLTFSLKTIMKRLGIPEYRLKKTLEDLELGKFKIDTIQPIRNTLLLKGSG